MSSNNITIKQWEYGEVISAIRMNELNSIIKDNRVFIINLEKSLEKVTPLIPTREQLDKIDNITQIEIVDNLSTVNIDKALSSNQGVELKKLIDSMQKEINILKQTIQDLTKPTVEKLCDNSGVVLMDKNGDYILERVI